MKIIEDQIDKLISCLQSCAQTDYIGEPVSQLQHALQSAYFAEQSGHGNDVILACLLHDIGHFASMTRQFNMAGLGIVNHEWIGAKIALDWGFSAKVALLIGYHVDAKRYLTRKKANYFEKLSLASQNTLSFQGGLMSDAELEQFEQHPYFKEILQVRINDEKAKEIDLLVPDLNHYRAHMQVHFKMSHHTINEIKLTDYVDALWVKSLKEELIT